MTTTSPQLPTTWPTDHAGARALDRDDPIPSRRAEFHIPPSPAHDDGRESIYLCGNSLGLQPKALRAEIERLMDDWAHLGVEGHFHARHAWYPFHEFVRKPAAAIVGALPHEVVVMNSLTVNCHLLMLSFYRPQGERKKILIDGPCFPSDVYAVKSQLRLHAHDPEADLLWARPRPGERTHREDDIIEQIETHKHELALIHLAGVNYATGQFYDIQRITNAAREHGINIGWDLAHAAGNVPLKMHDWAPDYAAWCSYKYLNSGPGAVAGAFIHERHLGRAGNDAFERFAQMPRLEGWWGNDPDQRFKMGEQFTPYPTADAWALSNPPIFAMLPVKVSYDMFAASGMDRLRQRSQRLTAYLAHLIDELSTELGNAFELVTPRDPARRGAQLSVRSTADNPRALHDALTAQGVLCDFREPDIIRLAPTPMYNTFEDCWKLAEALRAAAQA
ncbi:MAG: kynureninase [Phycisphaerales bacterium]